MRIPTNLIDNTYELFPPGDYDGSIDGAELRDPMGDSSWVILRVSLTDIRAREGTADTDRTTFSGDITLLSNDVDLRELDTITADTPFMLQRASGLLGGIAEGIGVTGERTNGAVDADVPAIVEALTNGQFEGERVGFSVSHYKPKGKDKVYEQFLRFGVAS